MMAEAILKVALTIVVAVLMIAWSIYWTVRADKDDLSMFETFLHIFVAALPWSVCVLIWLNTCIEP